MAKATKKKENDLRTPEEASKLFYSMLKASVNTKPIKKMSIKLQINIIENDCEGIEISTLKEGVDKETILFTAVFNEVHNAKELLKLLIGKNFSLFVIDDNPDYRFCLVLPDLKEEIKLKVNVDDSGYNYSEWIENKLPIAFGVGKLNKGMRTPQYIKPYVRFDDLRINPHLKK